LESYSEYYWFILDFDGQKREKLEKEYEREVKKSEKI